MICVLGVLSIISVVIILMYFLSGRDYRKINMIGTSIICAIAGSALIIGPLGSSYQSYLNIKADYYGVIAQYGAAVDVYSDKAVINVEKAAFTDFKYEGYQKQMAQMIEALRYKITNYNKIYIKKKTMDKNWIFSWIIIPPDSGMKLLQMIKDREE
jgi:hypothetical protein